MECNLESSLIFAVLDFSDYVERQTVRDEYKPEWNGDRDIIYADIDWVQTKALRETRKQLEADRVRKLEADVKSNK